MFKWFSKKDKEKEEDMDDKYKDFLTENMYQKNADWIYHLLNNINKIILEENDNINNKVFSENIDQFTKIVSKVITREDMSVEVEVEETPVSRNPYKMSLIKDKIINGMDVRFSVTILFKDNKVDDILFSFSENAEDPSVPRILYSEVLHAALAYKTSMSIGYVFFKDIIPIEKYITNDYSEWGKNVFKYKLNKKDLDYLEVIGDYLPNNLYSIKHIKEYMIYTEMVNFEYDFEIKTLKLYEKLVKAFTKRIFGEVNHVSEIPFLILEKIGILEDDQLNFMKREDRRDISLEKIILKLFG